MAFLIGYRDEDRKVHYYHGMNGQTGRAVCGSKIAAYRRQKAAETPHAARWAEYEQRMSYFDEYELVKKTPKVWNFLRRMYAAILPRIIERGRWNPYVVDWDMTPIEYDVWCSIRYYNVRPMCPQLPVGRYFVDFGDPVRRIAFECDGKQFHDRERDAKRDAEMRALGWQVYRFEGWRCRLGADDEESADARIKEIAEIHYPLVSYT